MYKLENPLMWEHQSKNKCAKNKRIIAKQTQLQEIYLIVIMFQLRKLLIIINKYLYFQLFDEHKYQLLDNFYKPRSDNRYQKLTR